MTTLAGFRQDVLNVDLGLDLTLGTSGDDDDSFGTTAVRNQAISVALAKLWPSVARLAIEDVTPSETSLEYDLSTLDDVEAFDLIGGAYGQPIDKGNNFRFLYDESAADAPVRRLRLPMSFSSGLFTNIRVIGYVRYIHTFADDTDELDIPAHLEWVVCAGARSEIYRRQLNQRVNYERFNIQSRDNDVTVEQMTTIYGMALSEFRDGMSTHRRQFATGHTFRP